MKLIDVNHPCGVCMAGSSEGGVCAGVGGTVAVGVNLECELATMVNNLQLTGISDGNLTHMVRFGAAGDSRTV
jgi:hypothetical protein